MCLFYELFGQNPQRCAQLRYLGGWLSSRPFPPSNWSNYRAPRQYQRL